MQRERRKTVHKEQDTTDQIESYLNEKYHTSVHSSHSKKSKYTTSSKLTKSTLFKTIRKQNDNETDKSKDLDIQIHLLQNSLGNLRRD